MEFEGRENPKVLMALLVLRFVIYRGKEMQVSRVANSFSYHFRNVRARMKESNNEMRQGQNPRWETDFNCVKPCLHPELLLYPKVETSSFFLGPTTSCVSVSSPLLHCSCCLAMSPLHPLPPANTLFLFGKFQLKSCHLHEPSSE